MGRIRETTPVTLICGIIAVDADVLRLAVERLTALFGPIGLESEVFPFTFTDYYRAEMGDGLLRKFISFSTPIDPGSLASIKTQTNRLEDELAVVADTQTRRQVNLDPGYITASKLVLATTKDFSHRLYLGQGIYGEVTLGFRKDGCVAHPWTYPDFRSGTYDAFFLAVRRTCPRV